MNGVRSTFMRKGYLLTALAALLLLASSGTASAQSVGFVGDTTVTVMEGAGVQGTRIPALEVTVSRTVAAFPPHDDIFETGDELVLLHNGALVGATIRRVADTAITSGANLNFPAGVHEMTLTITVDEDATWDDEELVLTLRSNVNGVVPDPAIFTAMIEDGEPQPEFRFHRTTIDVTETSDTSVDLSVGVGPYGSIGEGRLAAALGALGDNDGAILLAVNPPLAHGATDEHPVTLSIDGGAGADIVLGVPTDGTAGSYISAARAYNLGNISAAVATGGMITLNIKANPDLAGFQDPTITLTLVDGRPTANKIAGGGSISNGMAVLNVLSNEPKPTVSFSPTDVNVMEGGSDTSTLLASGKFGAEVGMVKLSVEGDAMVGLYQDGEMLEEMDGYVMVDLGDTNAARLTAMSYEDPDLMDGETAYKMWTIMEADGAEIDGDADMLTVMVEGATAVPALPLIGQLLLALFLMAGGSRLYRRRRG